VIKSGPLPALTGLAAGSILLAEMIASRVQTVIAAPSIGLLASMVVAPK
jgi:hypothetical protein